MRLNLLRITLLLPLFALSTRIIASYFCNLADQAGGGIGNQVACGVYRHADAVALLLTFAAVCGGLIALGVTLMKPR